MLLAAIGHLTAVAVEDVVVGDDAVTFAARTMTREAACPGCGTVSGQIHGGYQRRLADLAVAGRKAVINLLVRRFVCPLAECARRTFVEQIDGLTERYARRTPPLRRTLEKITLALAGRPAARLSTHLSVPASANSLLRLLRRLPDKPVGTAPRVLGVDDFALKRGHVYGTILLDMETSERVDVLPDRTSETLAAWLKAHPGVEIVCRDRASAYAEAVRTAAPNATQVADRFHVWMNLCEAVEKCVIAHRSCLAEPTAPEAQDQAAEEQTATAPANEADAATPAQMEGLRTVQRQERYAAVQALYQKGVGISAIAETLGWDRKTVRRYAHAASSDDLAPAGVKRGTRIQPYAPYLHRRWNEGCTDAARLCAEIREQGYRGSERTVRRHLQSVRASGKPAPAVSEQLTARQASRLINSHPDNLDETSTLKLKELLARCPALDAVAACVSDFAEMMAEREGQRLGAWLEQIEATGLQPLRSLANGIRQDFDAVTAGLTLDWNSGRVEGNVNRIKRIKRDGYGRAAFDLLRLQILRSD